MLFIAISLLFLFPPLSARTNHKPACQSAHQQALSGVHRVPYLAPFSHRDVSSVSRAGYPPEKRVYRVLRYFDFWGVPDFDF